MWRIYNNSWYYDGSIDCVFSMGVDREDAKNNIIKDFDKETIMLSKYESAFDSSYREEKRNLLIDSISKRPFLMKNGVGYAVYDTGDMK
jgi:hypothetical protein